MERVAAPLRRDGRRRSRTTSGHAPHRVDGGALRGTRLSRPGRQRPGQERGAAGRDGGRRDDDGPTSRAATRDHTERALAALGAPVASRDARSAVAPFQHEAFAARCPGDPLGRVPRRGRRVTGSALTIATWASTRAGCTSSTSWGAWACERKPAGRGRSSASRSEPLQHRVQLRRIAAPGQRRQQRQRQSRQRLYRRVVGPADVLEKKVCKERHVLTSLARGGS